MDRLIYLSDSGVVIEPDVYQKLEIIQCELESLQRRLAALLAERDALQGGADEGTKPPRGASRDTARGGGTKLA